METDSINLIKKKTNLITKIGAGNEKGSLRVYIPVDIVKEFNIKEGDHVMWVVLIDKERNETYIAFKKITD